MDVLDLPLEQIIPYARNPRLKLQRPPADFFIIDIKSFLACMSYVTFSAMSHTYDIPSSSGFSF